VRKSVGLNDTLIGGQLLHRRWITSLGVVMSSVGHFINKSPTNAQLSDLGGL
jgi:hypothetical protein